MLGVVALGLVGAAYTLWYEKLTLTADVSTGSLNADWSFHNWSAPASGEGVFDSSSSNSGTGKPVVAILTQAESLLNQGASHILGGGGTGTGSGRFTWGNFNPTSNVGVPVPAKPHPSCTGGITPAAAGQPDTLHLEMSGLFPFAGCEYQIDITSTGTVPFHVAVIGQEVQQCTGEPGNETCSDVTVNLPWTRGVVNQNDGNYEKCLALFNADWQGQIPGQINLPNGGAPLQIHPGTGLVCTFMLVLDENWRNNNDPNGPFISDQNLHFKVTTQYATYQWNESPSGSVLTNLP